MPNPSFWKDRSVLVAGATGFLGGWLVRRLLEHRAKITAIVRSPKQDSQFFLERFHDRVDVAEGDIADIGFIENLFGRRPEISVFFHSAYGADVNRVLKEPLECFHSSASSTWQILDLLRRKRPECISIISSTDKAYGNQKLPYQESNPLQPRHPYEVAKASQDLAAQSFGKIYGLPTAVTRCGNYYGGYDFNFSRLIPGVMKDLAEGRAPRLRSSGRFTRDFLYVEDAAEIQLTLAERLAENRSLCGEAFNFSYEVQIEIIDIVRRLAKLAGTSVEPIINDKTQVEIPHMRLSCEKAVRVLAWRPRFSFDEGLERTVDWYLKYFKNRTSRVMHAAAQA